MSEEHIEHVLGPLQELNDMNYTEIIFNPPGCPLNQQVLLAVPRKGSPNAEEICHIYKEVFPSNGESHSVNQDLEKVVKMVSSENIRLL